MPTDQMSQSPFTVFFGNEVPYIFLNVSYLGFLFFIFNKKSYLPWKKKQEHIIRWNIWEYCNTKCQIHSHPLKGIPSRVLDLHICIPIFSHILLALYSSDACVLFHCITWEMSVCRSFWSNYTLCWKCGHHWIIQASPFKGNILKYLFINLSFAF